jgi:pimeloyl-ACP methyl ester carboxylesterase
VSQIQTNSGITLYYERAGTGQPLLFINGLGANISETPYLTESYSRHFDYITYDRRGCGRSEKPGGAYSIAQDADDAAGLLDALGVERAAVYGSSLGGMVAQELALRHPHRVSALILGCTTGGAVRGVQPAPETLQRMAANQQLSGEEGWAAGWRLGYSDAYIAENYDTLLARSRASSQYGAPPDSYMRQIVAAAQHDVGPPGRDRLSGDDHPRLGRRDDPGRQCAHARRAHQPRGGPHPRGDGPWLQPRSPGDRRCPRS